MRTGIAWTAGCALALGAAAAGAAELSCKDAAGRWRARPPALDPALANPWTGAQEDAFWTRAQAAIRANLGRSNYGNTYFENEKASYPPAMFDALFGDRARGLGSLQAEDNQAGSWNSLTKGIDYYACFTLKHQMRKYFYLGPLLEPPYRERMKEGARLWTEKDPTSRPNPYFKKPGDGWTPETKNAWVDGRNTDNLRAMRETSVYLMAEETGNEAVRLQYKRAIGRYVWALWNIGMGEWDSENYHMHTFGPYLNLHDFAKDPEVKRTAKAALDLLSLMGAVKYYQGGFCRPIKRDYEKPYVFGGAAGELWLYFGDTPLDNPEPHGDLFHVLTSAYRPPAAVVALAQKRFARPVELFACKPDYETWKVEGDGTSKGPNYPQPDYQDAPHRPAYFETTFVGDTFQFGTLAQGSGGDVNGFKLLMRDPKKGAQFFVAASVASPAAANRGSGADRIAHYRNAALVLTARGDADWAFILPADAKAEDEDGVRFLAAGQTWIALRPVNLRFDAPDGQPLKKWANTQGMTARGTGGPASGYAIEIGDAKSHGSYADFKRQLLSKSKLDLSALGEGKASYTAAAGQTVGIADIAAPLPRVFRDGQERTFAEGNWAMYRPADGGEAPVSLGWKKGKLRVEAGSLAFDAELARDGGYTFRNGP